SLAAAVIEHHAAAVRRGVAADIFGDALEMRGLVARADVKRMLRIPEGDPVGGWHANRSPPRRIRVIAFSSEVGTGSREENASDKDHNVSSEVDIGSQLYPACCRCACGPSAFDPSAFSCRRARINSTKRANR